MPLSGPPGNAPTGSPMTGNGIHPSLAIRIDSETLYLGEHLAVGFERTLRIPDDGTHLRVAPFARPVPGPRRRGLRAGFDPYGIAVSPNGENVYVGLSQEGVARYDVTQGLNAWRGAR